MEKHCKELLHHVPDLLSRYVLDLGAGRGRFLIALVKLGGKGEGLEINPAYIKEAQKTEKMQGFLLKLLKVLARSYHMTIIVLILQIFLRLLSMYKIQFLLFVNCIEFYERRESHMYLFQIGLGFVTHTIICMALIGFRDGLQKK